MHAAASLEPLVSISGNWSAVVHNPVFSSTAYECAMLTHPPCMVIWQGDKSVLPASDLQTVLQ